MRRIKSLGLGALMALALMAVPAGASASGGIQADTYPVTLKGSQTGTHTLILQAGTVGCNNASLEGQAKGPVSTAQTFISPAWTCGKAAVKANGCTLELHAGSENSFDIGPPGCGPITTTVGGCTISINSQAGRAATFKNVGEGAKAAVLVTVEISNLEYTQKTISGWTCPKGPHQGGYYGTWEVKGFNAVGSQVGIHAVDEFSQGFFVSGKASENKADQPRFEAESYPATITGQQDPENAFELSVGELGPVIRCGTGEFSGDAAAPSAELALGAAYSQCEWPEMGGQGTAVDMNSCNYVFDLDNAGPPYSGGLKVACATEGDGIELILGTAVGKCTLKIAAQDVIGTVDFANQGTGSAREVDATASGTVKFTHNKVFVCNVYFGKEGTGTGTLTQGLSVHGVL